MNWNDGAIFWRIIKPQFVLTRSRNQYSVKPSTNFDIMYFSLCLKSILKNVNVCEKKKVQIYTETQRGIYFFKEFKLLFEI